MTAPDTILHWPLRAPTWPATKKTAATLALFLAASCADGIVSRLELRLWIAVHKLDEV